LSRRWERSFDSAQDDPRVRFFGRRGDPRMTHAGALLGSSTVDPAIGGSTIATCHRRQEVESRGFIFGAGKPAAGVWVPLLLRGSIVAAACFLIVILPGAVFPLSHLHGPEER